MRTRDHARVGHGHYLAPQPAKRVLRTRLGEHRAADAGLRRAHRPPRRDGCRCTRPATCWARPRCAWSTAARCGSPAATTRWRRTAPARRSSRCGATSSSPNRPSACRSTAGAPTTSCSPTSTTGGRATSWRAAPACSPATASARRSASCAASTPSIGPIVVHGAVEPLNRAYRAAGVALPRDAAWSTDVKDKADLRRALVVCPPQRGGQPVDAALRRRQHAFASGWMQLRGARRRARRGTAASCCRTTPTGLACMQRDRRHRRRARHRHARQRAGDGALAFRAGPAGRGVRHRIRRRRTWRPTSRPDAVRGRHAVKRLRRAVRRAGRHHLHQRQGGGAAALLRAGAGAGGRGLGGVLPGGRQAAPGGAHDAPARAGVRGRRHRAAGCSTSATRPWATWRRPSRCAAARQRSRRTSAWPNGWTSACCRCAAWRPRTLAPRCGAMARAGRRRTASCSPS